MLTQIGPGQWATEDGTYQITYRPGPADDYQITPTNNPRRWSIAGTLLEAQQRINGHRLSGGTNWKAK